MNEQNPTVITRTARCPKCGEPAMYIIENPHGPAGVVIERACQRCDFHDPPLQTERKPTGILWKLTPEEREALREVCKYASAYADDYARVAMHIEEKIRQLLGEEK